MKKRGGQLKISIACRLAIPLTLFFAFLFTANQSLKAQCISTFPHVEDFETAATWTAITAPTSSVAGTCDWTWGTPNHTYVIHGAGSGSKCWNIGGLTGSFYNFNQQSYIISPCYNFTNLQYPHVKFKLFYDSEYIYDGGNLQSSIDGGTTWQDVGTTGEATDCNTQNWYNYASITYLNKPTGFVTSKHGWCGNVEAGGTGWDATHSTTSCAGGNGIGKWVTAEHCLTGLAGKPSVLFRFTFGAGYSCNDFDGFAIDSVAISNGIINTTTITTSCGTANTINFASGAKACPTNTWAWNFGDAASGASNTSTAENPSHTFSGPGIYTVSVIASGGACNPPDTATKVVHVMSVSITSFTNAACGTLGAATALAANGTTPSYIWSNGINTATTTGLNAGTYTVTVTDPNACLTQTTVTIVQPSSPSVTAVASAANCTTPGSATATPTGGIAPYTYTWSPSGGNTATATGLATGNYTVTIKDANTCTATAVVNITSIGGITASVASTNVICNATNGSATATPSNGTAPYTYTWSPSGGNTATASGLSVGNYTVTIKDVNSCTTTAVANIINTGGITASITSTSVTCNGAANGSATVAPIGGTTPYSYTWSPSGGNSITASGLAAGNYTVKISDANTCTTTATTTILQPSIVLLSTLSASVTCNGASTGAATVTASGGTSPYTYTWSPSGGTNAIATNLSAGNYSVTVNDAHSCTATTTVTIIQPSSISLSTLSSSVTCNGASTGAATVTATGGTSPYAYSWSPSGGTNAIATNLAAGNYSVLVTDHNLCTTTTSLTINQPSALTASATSTPASCGNTNGTASVITSGGTPGYTYTWSPSGGNLNTATGLAGGNYTVTIKDANNCSITTQTTVAQTPSVNVTVTSSPASCGNANGTANAVGSGGTGPLNYTWSTGANTLSITNLSGNTTYTVSVSDALGCSISKSIHIGNLPSPVLSVASTSIACNGAATGTASVSINAGTGTAPFSYSWSPSGGANSSAINLTAGNYTVVVTDSANCTASSIVNITQPTAITATVTNTSASCGMANGTATVNATGGTPGYTYIWSTGATTTTATGLGAGVYNVTITDANNCTYTTQTTVTSNSSINLSLTSTPATCGLSNGTIAANVTGGTPAQSGYVYTWNPTVGVANTASALMPGVYSLSVEDSLQCVTTKTITVGNKPNPVLSVTSTSVTCFGASTGSAVATINAGTGTAPFMYVWMPGASTNSSIQNLAAGNYTVGVIDSANCTATATVSIMQPPALTITLNSTLATCGNANGVASCTVTGGTPGYNYVWTPSGGNQSTATNLAGNITYTVTVTDANSCVQTNSIFVLQTSAITLSVVGTTSVSCFGESTGSATVSAVGGTSTTYAYNWLPNGGTSTINSNLAVGVYTVSVVDVNSCSATTTLTIVQPPPVNVSVNSQSICANQTASLTASASGGNGSTINYTWTPTNTNTQAINVSPTITTTYVVMAQNTGCTQTTQASGVVSVYPSVNISITPIDSVCKGTQATLAASATGGSGGGFTYSWSCGQNTASILVNPSATTSYTVWAHDAVCPAVAATTEIYLYAEPILTITPSLTSGCNFVCTSFTAAASSVPGNNIVPPYNWNFGDGATTSGGNNAQHCYNKTGNYNVSLTVKTQNNCIDTLTELNFIHVHQKPVADFSASAFETDIYDNTIHFYNQSTGNIVNWNWNTDTTTYTIQNPTHTYSNEGVYPVTLIVTDNIGCKDTIVKDVTINPSYTFYAPNCVTPNGDGKNETFLPIGEGWDNNHFDLWIFDRWGNMIFHTTNPNEGWDGKRYNEVVQEDTYVWKVVLKDIFGKEHDYHGQVSVVR